MRLILPCLLALMLPVSAASSPFVPDFSAGPIVFDFEAGLDGWVPNGQVQRAETDLLGGQWAVLGDGYQGPNFDRSDRATLTLTADLTLVSAMSFELFRIVPTEPNVVASVRFLDVIEDQFASYSLFESPDRNANPGLRTLDLSGMTGVGTIIIGWVRGFDGGCTGGPQNPVCGPEVEPPGRSAYIDNITLFPVPEPSPGLLLGTAGLGASFAARPRTRRGR